MPAKRIYGGRNLDGSNPFHYLVPDERILPAESIRLFQVDPIWIECLVDGAFSIGRVSQSDQKHDQLHKENRLNAILRSK